MTDTQISIPGVDEIRFKGVEGRILNPDDKILAFEVMVEIPEILKEADWYKSEFGEIPEMADTHCELEVTLDNNNVIGLTRKGFENEADRALLAYYHRDLMEHVGELREMTDVAVNQEEGIKGFNLDRQGTIRLQDVQVVEYDGLGNDAEATLDLTVTVPPALRDEYPVDQETATIRVHRARNGEWSLESQFVDPNDVALFDYMQGLLPERLIDQEIRMGANAQYFRPDTFEATIGADCVRFSPIRVSVMNEEKTPALVWRGLRYDDFVKAWPDQDFSFVTAAGVTRTEVMDTASNAMKKLGLHKDPGTKNASPVTPPPPLSAPGERRRAGKSMSM